jgi:hypothetical protein
MIELPKTYELDRDFNWVRPKFEPYNGIVEQNIWALEGLVAALGFVNRDEQRIIGSGVMVAPGVCLTATHVIQETLNQHALLFSFPTKTAMRIWSPLDFHALEHKNNDYFLIRPEKNILMSLFYLILHFQNLLILFLTIFLLLKFHYPKLEKDCGL